MDANCVPLSPTHTPCQCVRQVLHNQRGFKFVSVTSCNSQCSLQNKAFAHLSQDSLEIYSGVRIWIL